MMRDLSYAEAVKKADHLKALGVREVFLRGDPPWDLATNCEPGCSHRLDMSTSVWFYAEDAKTGLTFRWSFDIEPLDANGTGSYKIDVPACVKAIHSLRGGARRKFQEYLAECAEKVDARGKEFQEAADWQAAAAMTLRRLAVATPQPDAER